MDKNLLRIGICDDDKFFAEKISTQVASIFNEHSIPVLVKTYTEPDEFVKSILKENVDLIIVDVDMPKISGFDIMRKIKLELSEKRRPVALFVSSNEQFVFDSFQYGIFDFVRKEQLENDLKNKLDNYITRYQRRFIKVDLIAKEDGVLYLDEVLYFQSERNKVFAITADNSYQCRGNLGQIEQIYSDNLLRISKSQLVNMKAISKIKNGKVFFFNGQSLPISRRRELVVTEQYMLKRSCENE